jgi:hypothetical protein
MSLKKTVSTLKLKEFIEKNSSPTVPLNTSCFYVTPKSILIVARNRKKNTSIACCLYAPLAISLLPIPSWRTMSWTMVGLTSPPVMPQCRYKILSPDNLFEQIQYYACDGVQGSGEQKLEQHRDRGESNANRRRTTWRKLLVAAASS